eukprot:m.43066 g.43066  ORF g.43066 m.43066 type:complete len:95 (-) comp17082_c0_seq1:306-590(-)
MTRKSTWAENDEIMELNRAISATNGGQEQLPKFTTNGRFPRIWVFKVTCSRFAQFMSGTSKIGPSGLALQCQNCNIIKFKIWAAPRKLDNVVTA